MEEKNINPEAMEVLAALAKVGRRHSAYATRKAKAMNDVTKPMQSISPSEMIRHEIEEIEDRERYEKKMNFNISKRLQEMAESTVPEALKGEEGKKEKMRGLGDLVARTIKATTGIESKEGCGCKKRQKLLNKWVPFHKRDKKK